MQETNNYRLDIKELEKTAALFTPPAVPENIPHGDMPGDEVRIKEEHIKKANVIFPELLRQILPVLSKSGNQRAVVTVCGGSGVGKSEIASLLSFYFKSVGVGSYTLSGDNYPHRIPMYNDAERLRIFRESAVKGMVAEDEFTPERFEVIQQFQKAGTDGDPAHSKVYPWYAAYINNGRKGLSAYLGSNAEIGFDEVEQILSAFQSGQDEIWLKRMGRTDAELWYEKVDFSGVHVLVIEWTHGNSDCYKGVDIPVLLNSTPRETLAHRKERNRDGGTDSPFTTMVLQLEQEMLTKQAEKAKIILSKNAEILTYSQFCQSMEIEK